MSMPRITEGWMDEWIDDVLNFLTIEWTVWFNHWWINFVESLIKVRGLTDWGVGRRQMLAEVSERGSVHDTSQQNGQSGLRHLRRWPLCLSLRHHRHLLWDRSVGKPARVPQACTQRWHTHTRTQAHTRTQCWDMEMRHERHGCAPLKSDE